MALFDWLKKRLAGDTTAELKLAPDEENLSGLNLRQVIDAHMAWKDRLQSKLNGTSTEVINVSTTAMDNGCVLGKWLYGPGKQAFGTLPEYEALRKIHAKFHLTAGEVLMRHEAGETDAATQLLKGPFANYSNGVQLELVRLFTRSRK